MTHRPSEDGLLDSIRLDVSEEFPTFLDNNGASVSTASRNLSTPRMWTLSLFFAIFGSAINLFFSLRYPSVTISPIIALLLAHPLGLLWDHSFTAYPKTKRDRSRRNSNLSSDNLDESSPLISPSRGGVTRQQSPLHLPTASGLDRIRAWLGQGEWNEQEHCCVYIASNVSFGFAFATDVIVEQKMFYGQDVGILYQLLLTLSTQILGYAIAGVTRAFLVRPSGMIWPTTLVSRAMFSSLHKNENKPAGNWTMSPFRFFLYVFLGSSAFYLLPGFLMPALSYFNIVTWLAPQSVVVANLFGVSSGLGLFPLTFDWSQIAYIGSPLVVPFWAAMNIIGGLVAVVFILAPILYYSNVMYSSYMPIQSSAVFDNRGNMYNVTRVLTNDFVFDHTAYSEYSRVFMSTTYILSYALQFAALPALIVHTVCWYGKDVWGQCKTSWGEARFQIQQQKAETARRRSFHSNHSSTTLSRQSSNPQGLEALLSDEEMARADQLAEDDVPILWYLLIGLSMTGVGLFVVENYDVHLPWYGLLLAIGMCSVLFIPIGIIQAITNQQSSLYLVSQLICGSLFPGRPVANMVFVTYGYITSTQGLKFAADLKLGQVYMGIPPKLLFKLQLAATVIASCTQVGVLNWMLSNIPGICTPQAVNGFTCPLARVHFNGSILWGVIGPAKFFGKGELYRPLIWAFPVGVIAPLFVYLVARRRRRAGNVASFEFLSKINFPVLLGSLSWIPPATALNFSAWGLICYIFNYRILKSHKDWWYKYTMTLSAALDSGLAVGVLAIFFVLVYPGWTSGFKWWGTEVYKQGCDWQACPYREPPPGGIFGPSQW